MRDAAFDKTVRTTSVIKREVPGDGECVNRVMLLEKDVRLVSVVVLKVVSGSSLCSPFSI